VPDNADLAALSDYLTLATALLYSVAMLCYAAELAFGHRQRLASEATAQERELVGAGAPAPDTPTSGSGSGVVVGRRLGRLGRIGTAITAIGLIVHFCTILSRGFAADRLPWGNMHEFILAISFGAVAVYLAVAWRYKAYFVGLFVLIPVVLGLGLAATALYTPVGMLQPALQSNYWIAIHVSAAVLSSGTFLVAAALNVTYLLASQYEKKQAVGGEIGLSGVARKLPASGALERLSYRITIFGFPVWTFAIVAGAMWADQAWGRYWGWDPKEIWAFITWVVYACYLHARSTAGWRGRRASWVQLLAFGCLMFNLFGVNIWFKSLHSYAGL